MLDWLNFRLEVIISLIHALEKRYYQNKTQFRYNFGAVYIVEAAQLYGPYYINWPKEVTEPYLYFPIDVITKR